jgi:hypothetical protein
MGWKTAEVGHYYLNIDDGRFGPAFLKVYRHVFGSLKLRLNRHTLGSGLAKRRDGAMGFVNHSEGRNCRSVSGYEQTSPPATPHASFSRSVVFRSCRRGRSRICKRNCSEQDRLKLSQFLIGTVWRRRSIGTGSFVQRLRARVLDSQVVYRTRKSSLCPNAFCLSRNLCSTGGEFMIQFVDSWRQS